MQCVSALKIPDKSEGTMLRCFMETSGVTLNLTRCNCIFVWRANGESVESKALCHISSFCVETF